MDTYVRTVIFLVFNVILEVKGQGGVAIPWGQGISVNMADFDPFAGRRDKPDFIVMDPHDPKSPKFASEPALVGGVRAERRQGIKDFTASDTGGSVAIGMGLPFGRSKPPKKDPVNLISGPALDSKNLLGTSEQWSKESSFSSFSSSSSSSKEFRESTGPRTRPRGSGGVAINLSGPVPGNDNVTKDNDTRLSETASLNYNASALNVSVYGDTGNALLADIYNASYSKANSTLYNGDSNIGAPMYTGEGPGRSGMPSTYFSIDKMLSSALDIYFTDTSNTTHKSENVTNVAIDMSNSTNITLPEDISNTTLQIDSIINDYNNGTNDLSTVTSLPKNMSEIFETNYINETVSNGTDMFSNSSDVLYDDTEPTDLIFTHPSSNAVIYNDTEGPLSLFKNESMDNSTSETNLNTSDMNVGYGSISTKITEIPSFNAPGIVGPTIMPSFTVPISDTNNKLMKSNQKRHKTKAVFYDKALEKLKELNKLYTFSSRNKENPSIVRTVQGNREEVNLNGTAAVSASALDIGKKTAENIHGSYNVSSVVKHPSGLSSSGSPNDIKYNTADLPKQPQPKHKASVGMGVPVGMGIPISMGFNVPDPPAKTRPIKPLSSGPFDQSVHPEVISGLEGGTFVTVNVDSTLDKKTDLSKQDSVSINGNINSMLAADQVAPDSSVKPSLDINQPLIREPVLPVSRQPIIETQPAVDFMSTFLSQPIDPTRRGDRQQPVNTQTDINIVPLENQKPNGPSQTLVQDGKSRDWRSFISSFLMGGPGFDQMGGPTFDQMRGDTPLGQIGEQPIREADRLPKSQLGDPSLSQMDSLTKEPLRDPVFGQMNNPASDQTGVQSQPQFDSKAADQMIGPILENRKLPSVSQPGINFTPEIIDFKQARTTDVGQSGRSSVDLIGTGFMEGLDKTAVVQPGDFSLAQKQEPQFVKMDQTKVQSIKPIDNPLRDFKNPFVDAKPFQGPDIKTNRNPNKLASSRGVAEKLDPAAGQQLGINTDYQVSLDGQVQNVLGLSETRPLDAPLPAETTSISTRLTPIDSSKPAVPTTKELGLSDQPLTSFEGASTADLQKLKLLEVAQRLLLQERGIKDPQAGSQSQTFTPLGMPGGIENLLTSLNQANNMADMIKKRLNQGSSEPSKDPLSGVSANLFDNIKPTEAPRRNVKLGEWSSGIPVGMGLQKETPKSVPIGNMFAGRFLQSGAGLPSVKRDSFSSALHQAGGVAIGQSVNSLISSDVSVSRGGGFAVQNKLPYVQKECRAIKDLTSKYHFYRTVRMGRIRFRCALGTAFDEETCECSTRVISNGNCLEVNMNFNNGRVEDVSPNELPVGNENVEVTNRTAAYPGIAIFDGTAKLIIWRYQNYDFRDHLMLKLRFRPGIGGDRYQPLITNCDGSPDGPSVGVVFDNHVNEVILMLRTDSNTDKNLRFKVGPNRWIDVTYLYDGSSFIGLVNNDRQAMPTKGLVLIRDEALVLGYCPRFGHYNGAIDDVKIYTCIPKENRFLL